MTQSDVDSIYKALRVLPEFDGNPHVLTRFIDLCDQLVLKYFIREAGHELENLALINGILNKVSGPAARLINSNGIPENWQGIRSALINNFADHRDETALYSDLSLQTQGSNTPQEFYERCQNLFSTIMTYISLHETVSTTVEAKRVLYQKLTLQAYLRGLKDPLGYRIRCMRPETMQKALEFVQEELNTLYLQQRNEGGSNKKDWQQSSPNNLPLNNFVPKPNLYNMPIRNPIINMPGPSRQPYIQPQTMQGWKPHIQQHPMQMPRGPTRTQQMMRMPPQNYNPHSNVFRLPNKPPPQKSFNFGNTPRPMSGVSHYVPKILPPSGHDFMKHGNPPPSNYFKTREVNFNEFDYNNYYGYHDQEEYPDYEQFYTHDQYCEYYYPEQCYYPETPIVEEVEPSDSPSETENFQKVPKSEKPK